jgi:hypothetical protein
MHMRVVALQQGYYNHRLIEPGQVFLINNDGDYSPEWMRPAKGETQKPAPKRPHKTDDELLQQEHERSIHYSKLNAKDAAKQGKATGETEELEHSDAELAPPPPSKRKKAAAEAPAEAAPKKPAKKSGKVL